MSKREWAACFWIYVALFAVAVWIKLWPIAVISVLVALLAAGHYWKK